MRAKCATTYRAHQETIRLMLHVLRERLAAHASDAEDGSWDAVGDLAHIREQLMTMLVSLSGNRSETAARCQIEALLAQRQGRYPVTQADGSMVWVTIPAP